MSTLAPPCESVCSVETCHNAWSPAGWLLLPQLGKKDVTVVGNGSMMLQDSGQQEAWPLVPRTHPLGLPPLTGPRKPPGPKEERLGQRKVYFTYSKVLNHLCGTLRLF